MYTRLNRICLNHYRLYAFPHVLLVLLYQPSGQRLSYLNTLPLCLSNLACVAALQLHIVILSKVKRSKYANSFTDNQTMFLVIDVFITRWQQFARKCTGTFTKRNT